MRDRVAGQTADVSARLRVRRLSLTRTAVEGQGTCVSIPPDPELAPAPSQILAMGWKLELRNLTRVLLEPILFRDFRRLGDHGAKLHELVDR